MHEMGLVQSIMEIVEQQVVMHNIKRVVRISLEFGLLTAVQPQAIEFAFEVLSKGTIADNAALDIKIIPLKIWCMECSKAHVLADYRPDCPECNSTSVHIIEGKDEMRIASLEADDGEE